MISYVPFLKSKSNEIIAIGLLERDVVSEICPFFDYPRRDGGDEEGNFQESVAKLVRSLNKHASSLGEFYFDCYDLDDRFEVAGVHVYQYLLNELADLPLVPVVSIDRSVDHQYAVRDLKKNSIIDSRVVAFRVTPEDFQSYTAVRDDIEEELAEIFELFDQVDLVLDCRVCVNSDIQKISNEICSFANEFSNDYPVRRFVIAGSSIPASVAEVLEPKSERYINRSEIDIYDAVREASDEVDFILGDYTTVSPNYSDVDIPGNQMQNRTTAKFVYSFENQQYFIRGGSLKTQGASQYFDLAAVLCNKPFFRGAAYSSGDKYLEEKSRRIGKNCTPSTVVKPSVNAHITFMVKDFL